LRSDRRRWPLRGAGRIARCLTALAAVAAVAACGNRPPGDRDYAANIARTRAQKDAAFRKDADPVPANRKAELLPLSYFPIDPNYDTAAVLKPPAAGPPPDGAGTPAGHAAPPAVIVMPTSTGGQREMRRVGTLEFLLKGQPLKLTAFVEVGAPNLDRLFVPFTDLTTGAETYPAGRYLDLDRNGSGIYDLDFNRAYHPYCYYNPNYDCPYPPSENRLKIPIRAGERLKKEDVKS
jgi:uncharacterized protein (DUF1684 family)